MNKCYGDYLKYEFDVDGNTVPKCTAAFEDCRTDGRKICPHYSGKCPAIVGFGDVDG